MTPRVQIDLQLAQDIALGRLCVECGCEFVLPHGHRVACAYCFRRLENRHGIQLATEEEVDVRYHKERARHHRKKVHPRLTDE